MADLCEACATSHHPGILWPWMPNGDDSLPWVVRCDDCEIYDTDDAAAEALAIKIGRRVMWAEVGRDIDSDDPRDYLQPFVFAFEDSDVEPTTKVIFLEDGSFDGIHEVQMFDKWLGERKERFGSRRGRYDEAMSDPS